MSTETTPIKAEEVPVESKKKKITMAIGGITAGLLIAAGVIIMSPPALATNEQVRNAYHVDIIDNPNFKGKDMLKVNDEKLAELCVRPTVDEVKKLTPLNCRVL